MAVNYYPPCPEPELTYGLPGHTDPNALTILLQDLQVAGLQVLKEGKWLAVNPHPNAFVINLGDQLLHTGDSHMQSTTRSFGVGTWKKNIAWNFSRKTPLVRSSQLFFFLPTIMVLFLSQMKCKQRATAIFFLKKSSMVDG